MGGSVARDDITRGRHRALDGVRAIAVLAVFAGHTGYAWGRPGFIGVQVFFTLSGYLITSLLLREWQVSGRIALSRFYKRRLLRLYPALLGVLVVGLVFYRDVGDGGTLAGYGRTALAAGLYVQDFVSSFSGPHGGLGVTWSLAVEEQFYLIWPPILILALRHRKTRLTVTLVAVALFGAIANQLIIHENWPHGYGFTPWLNSTALIIGCALAFMLAEPNDWVSRRLGLRAGDAAAAFGVIGLAGLWLVADRVGNGHLFSVQLVGCAVSSAALIFGLERASGCGIARVLSSKPLAGLGLISYGFYLYHAVVLHLVAVHVGDGRLVNSCLALVITIGVAIISYVAIEKPFLRIKGRLAGPPLANRDHEGHLGDLRAGEKSATR